MMIGRRWVHHAALWTALNRVTTGFGASGPIGSYQHYLHIKTLTTSNLHQFYHHAGAFVGQRHVLTSLGSVKDGSVTSNAITATSFSSTDESSTPSSTPSSSQSSSSSADALGSQKRRRSWSRKWRRPLGFSLSVVGFCQSAIYAIFAPHRPPKLRSAIRALRRYLRETAIDEEFRTILNHRLVVNLLILRRLQRQLVPSIEDNRTPSSSSSSMVLPCPSESLRFMKYATAVYGDAMIRAAELELDDRFDARLLGTPSQEQVRHHCRMKDTDVIVSFDIDYDGDSSHMRHMIVVDHSHRNIILSIRGTFSLSEIAVDMAAFSRPFCDGEAHSEMANMAEMVWAKAEPTIRQLKTQHPDYQFVLTGHSLGAGVATLIHMMLQYREKDETFFQSQCMSYAAPPTIKRHRPLERCINFIHDQDIIPFLSVDSVRRLCKSVQTIDEEHMSLVQRWTAVRSPSWTNEKLLEKLRDLPSLSARDGAPALHSAAETNVWLRRHVTNTTMSSSFFDYHPDDDDDEPYKVELWDAFDLLNVSLRLEITHDHLPSLYEQALSQWSNANELSS